MLPSWPPGIPPLCGLPPLASLASDLSLVAYFVVAEALVVFCTRAAVALEDYSRSDLLARARADGREEQVEARLDQAGAWELSARLVRFIASTMLIVGIAFLALSNRIGDGTAGEVHFPWEGVAIAVGVTFLVSFVLNDVLLKHVARRHPTRFLYRSLPVLEVLRVLTVPLRLPLAGLVHLLFRARLIEPEQTAREEVLESVEEGEREGSLTPSEADMIESIMDMDHATAEDIGTPRGEIAMVQEDARLDETATFMIERGHRRVPVFGKDRDDVVGVIYAFDLLQHIVRGNPGRPVHEIMRSPFFVPEGKPVNDLLAEMRGRRVSLAVVLNEFGGTSAVVTMEDVLEEIVGDIEDEHDSVAPPPVTVRDGALYVDGKASIEEVNEALSIDLPVHNDFETVGGLVFHRLGQVPRVGDRLTVEGVSLTVTEADERTVKRLRVRVPTRKP